MQVVCAQPVSPSFNFINILCARFSYESAFLWLRFGKKSTFVQKTSAQNIDEIDSYKTSLNFPGIQLEVMPNFYFLCSVTWDQFHQHSTYSFYALRSRKRKKYC